MHEEVYRKLKEKKRFLMEFLTLGYNDRNLNIKDLEERWVIYSPKVRQDFSVAVADGSQIVQSFIGYHLGIVAGYGYFYNLSNKDKKEIFFADVDISFSKRPEFMKSLMSMLMFLLELKTLYKIAMEKKPDLIIFDGTITSRLITPYPRAEWFIKLESVENIKSGEELEYLVNSLSLSILEDLGKEGIRSFLDFDGIYTTSVGFLKDIIIPKVESALNTQRRDFIEAVIAKLSYYELMYTLAELSKMRDSTVIGVAKTSSGVDVFKSYIPDIKIFSHVKTLGYSKELIPQDVSNLKSSFGQIVGEDISSFLSDLQIYSFYSKYASPDQINLIEFIQNPNTDTINREELLDKLHSISVDGYPFLLKKVDNEVRITRQDLEIAIRELGLEREITGREPL